MPDTPQVEIPNRALFKAVEVCELAKVQPYVLRSWEAEFPDLGVAKTAGAPRVYRRADVQQVLDPQHPLDVRPAVDPRPALHLGDAEILELRLPRAQHVGLQLRDLAHLRLPEQRPTRDLDRVR